MYYTVYKTTNQVNGKFYIGTHKTIDLNDDYMGSGTLLKKAIQKYGLDNFKKEILFVFDNPEDMFAKEAEIVTEDFLSEENTYNLKVGGFGGFDYLNSLKDNPTHAKEHLIHIGKRSWEVVSQNEDLYQNHIDRASVRLKTLHAEGRVKYDTFIGKKHTEETKKKISDANKKMIGNLNSQYGSMWITDGMVNKKLKKTDSIPDGWRVGRKMKL